MNDLLRDHPKTVTRDVTRVCLCGEVFSTTDRRKMFHSRACGSHFRMARMRSQAVKEAKPTSTMETLKNICAGKFEPRKTKEVVNVPASHQDEWVDPI